MVVSSPRAEAVGEAEHLLDAIADRDFPLGGLVVNLIHPMPEPITDDDEELLAGISEGPLADQLEWHRELTKLAHAERLELVELERLAGDAPIIELPLLDVDIHDVPGLIGLAERLV